jgi:hypothetical protein
MSNGEGGRICIVCSIYSISNGGCEPGVETVDPRTGEPYPGQFP